MKKLWFLLVIGLALISPACIVCAEGVSGQSNTSGDVKQVSSISIAIIDFESKAPGNPEFGSQIGDILTARLSIYDQFRLVDRQKLEDLLKEHQLNLTGMVDTAEAVRAGKLLGAKIMVFGRAFVVDKDLYVVAKVVGTETSQVKGVMAKGKLESNLSDIIDELVEKLAEGLEKWSSELLPKNERFQDRVNILKEQLAGKELPTIAVIIPEIYINRQVIDPAAETEIKNLFQRVGFTIIEVNRETTSKWAKDFQKDLTKPMPLDFSDVDIVIVGEGFSEFGTRIGGLVSCAARLEVQAVDRQSHKIITSQRTTQRAVDLSETIAGKTALQAAGHKLGIELIEKIATRIANAQEGTDVPETANKETTERGDK